MNRLSKTLIALSASAFVSTAAFADGPDATMTLSATTLLTNQDLTVTFSSKTYCSIQMSALGLDDPSQSQLKPPQYLKTFTPPEQYHFTFAKAGKYRIWAKLLDGTTCGNMKSVPMMTDIVVNAPPQVPVIVSGNLQVSGSTTSTTKAATTTTTKAATTTTKSATTTTHCKKPNKPGVGKDCDL